MSQVTFKGQPVTLGGKFPQIGAKIQDFKLVTNDLKDVTLADFSEPQIILNIFPSLDTPTCSASVRKFNEAASNLKNTKVLCISKDLPFAQARFCGAENLNNVQTLSAFRSADFAENFGVDIKSSVLAGLLARAVIVLNAKREVIYTELVTEITHEPDYQACLKSITNI